MRVILQGLSFARFSCFRRKFHPGRLRLWPISQVVASIALCIRKAVQIEYGLDEMPAPLKVVEIGEAWRPHRSLASLYLWESLAAVPGA